MMKSVTLLVFASAAGGFASNFEGIQPRQANWTVGQTVQTSSGPVAGHAATNDSTVSEYLGIPFGKAPIGDLRFAAPVKFTGTAPLNGSSFGFSCPVQSGGSGGLPSAASLAAANVTVAGLSTLALYSYSGGKYSEDCLFLNVWTKPQVGDSKKAVLLWIYGGGFSGGTSSIPGYNGANIAGQEDVIVVTINYRLSVLGFPGNPSGTNNLGLLDQRLAVEWVRDNIQNFGGDPSRITLFGQSAGAASIDFYSYAWNSDPIAAGFVPESGNVFGWGLPNSKATGAAAWYNVTATLGCGNSSSDPASVLACMRTKNSSEILNAVPSTSGTAGILGYFGPTVDDTVVFANYSQRTPAKLPMLVGNNNYEGGLFRTNFALAGIFYPDVFWDDFNLQEFTCPTGVRANASVAAGIPIWRYRYHGVFPNLAVSTEAGTWHAAEIPILFNIMPAYPPPTAAEINIANYMRGAWAAFAKDPTQGLTKYGWPVYNPSQDTLIRLAYDNITGPNLINPYRYDADCVFVNISSTDNTYFPVLPDLGASVTPTGTGTGTGTVSATVVASNTATGTSSGTAAPSATSSAKSGGGKVEISALVGLGALFLGYLV